MSRWWAGPRWGRVTLRPENTMLHSRVSLSVRATVRFLEYLVFDRQCAADLSDMQREIYEFNFNLIHIPVVTCPSSRTRLRQIMLNEVNCSGYVCSYRHVIHTHTSLLL